MDETRRIRQMQEELQTLRKKSDDKSKYPVLSTVISEIILSIKLNLPKRNFYKRAFSSRGSKEVWRVIHSVLHPSSKPLLANLDELNLHCFQNRTRHWCISPNNGQRMVIHRNFAMWWLKIFPPSWCWSPRRFTWTKIIAIRLIMWSRWNFC